MLSRRRAAMAATVLFGICGSSPSGASFGVEEIVQAKSVQTARLSPDGTNILYTVQEIDFDNNRYLTSLWTVKWSGGEPQQLVPGSDVRMPRWSPNSETIAFFSNRDGETKIWFVSLKNGRIWPLQIAKGKLGPISTHLNYSGLEWSPDGRMLTFVAQDLEEPSDPHLWKDWYREEGFGDIRHRVQIWTVNTAGGVPVQLTKGDYHHGQPTWSPDGTQIAFMANRSGGRDESILGSINENYDLWVVPSSGGAPRKLTNNEGPDTHPVWSPDGRFLAYLTVPYQGSHNDVSRLYAVDTSSGEVKVLTDLTSFDFDVNLESNAWAGSNIFFTASVGVSTHAFRIESANSVVSPETIVGGEGVVSSVSISRDGNRLALVIQNPTHAPEVWASLSDGRRLQQLTNSGQQFVPTALADTTTMRWQSRDGFQIEGLLVTPPGFDPNRQYPLIVRPHGGPHGTTSLDFNIDHQFYASLGYIVFAPNIRGSSGYGQSFVDANRGNLGGGDFQDLMSGVDHLIRQGFIDPSRLVIVGLSYGGFMTTWAVGHTDRFKAAVAHAPVVNVQSFFGITDIPKWVTWEYLGPPWKNPDLVRANSPITYVRFVTTPTLITHGSDDVRVPISQAHEFYRSLRVLGVPTELVVYPGERHIVSSPKYQVDRLVRTAEWFAKYIDSD